MEDNKYYTPELEEFHVGFEYEIEDLGDDGRTRVWRPQIFEGEETRTYFIEELEKGEMRVKHLDREDIESLGFTNINNYFFELRTQFFIYRLNLSKTITIESRYIAQKGFASVVFSGTLKNKSELISQLKRCGIKL